jgi:hypothetical protein
MSGDYEVGYGKPPKEHQIKKGERRNPKGRPKKSKSIQNLLEQELNLIIPVKEGGRDLRLTKREAIVKRHVNAALNGNIKALEYLLNFCNQHGIPDPFQITIEDAEAVEAALRRHSDDAGQASPP